MQIFVPVSVHFELCFCLVYFVKMVIHNQVFGGVCDDFDIEVATKADLMKMKNVGEKKADNILAPRVAN